MEGTVVVISQAEKGKRLIDVLNENGHPHAAPCGGMGICRKCRVKVLQGAFRSADDFEKVLLPDGEGYILSCRALCPPEGGKVLVASLDGDGLVQVADEIRGEDLPADWKKLGVALDVGTTTLAAALVSLDGGKVLKTASCLNPQSGFGADVMSRISAAKEGNLFAMQSLLLKSVRALFDILLGDSSEKTVTAMTVAGNPTMLHLFCGVSPEGMGQYPFTPSFLETRVFDGASFSLPCETVTLLPSASAFVGSDVVGGILTEAMTAYDKPTVLLDIGTNGEMVLCTGKEKGSRLFVTSAAAGPALEGARISCGMGGVPGAVSSVKLTYGLGLENAYADEGFVYRTVGDMPAKGICGAGLCDLAACLLDTGIMDETGYLEEAFRLAGRQLVGGSARPYDKTAVTLTEEDVRELQLAKSALRAGLETLLAEGGVALEEVEKTFLAGGLGYYIDPMSAVRIGLLPKALLSTVKTVGNSSLAGAIVSLVEENAEKTMAKLASEVTAIELNLCPMFSELFMEYMLFPESEE